MYINGNNNSETAYCAKCSLVKERQERYVESGGSGSNGIMLVGQCPGEVEIKRKRLFVGPAGIELDRLLKCAKIDLSSYDL